jgi:WD40 repeat protein
VRRSASALAVGSAGSAPCSPSRLEPDRRFVAIGYRNHATRVWDTSRDQLLAELPSVTPVHGDFTSAFPAVSAAGDRAAIARGNTVVIYELPGGRLLRTIAHVAAVNAVAFAPTGHDLVSGAVDGSLLVTRDDREPVALPTSLNGIDAARFLADGRVVAAAGKRLRVYAPDRNTIGRRPRCPDPGEIAADVTGRPSFDHRPELPGQDAAGTVGS